MGQDLNLDLSKRPLSSHGSARAMGNSDLKNRKRLFGDLNPGLSITTVQILPTKKNL